MASKNKTIVTGNNLELDVKNNIGDFNKIIGNTTQETTTGKNLLNLSNYTTKTSNGITAKPIFNNNLLKRIEVSGTFSQTTFIDLYSGVTPLVGGTVYTLSGAYSSSIRLRLREFDSNNSVISEYLDQGNGISFTAKTDSVKISVQIVFYSISNVNIYPQIENNSTKSTYEPYTNGVSPNPDYPQKVETVGSNINLFDKDNANTFAGNIASTTSTTITAATYSRILYIPITGGKTYSIQKKKDSRQNRFVIATSINTPNVGIAISQVNIVDNYSEYTISTNKNANYLCVLYIQTNGAIMTEQETLESIKIEEGSQATQYTPYGKGSVEVKIRNKNLFTTANQILAYIGGSSFVLGDSSTSNDNYTAIIPIKPNTSYTISRSIISSRFRVGFYSTKNALGKTLRNGRTSDSATNMTVTSGENDYYLYLYYWTKNDTTSAEEIASTIQVEEGSTITDYIQPKQQTYLLYLPFELCKIGEYKDYIFKENNKWYKHKAIGKFTYNNEGTINSPATNYYNISSIGNLNSSTVLETKNYISNKYPPVAIYNSDAIFQNATQSLNYAFGFHPSGTGIRFKDTRGLTSEQFKADLIGATFYYLLKTPIDEEITDTTLIQQLNELENILLYNGINYISMEGNGTFEFQYGSKFDFYLSENNYLILNDTNKYLCSISESEIPDMPEAVDTTAKIAGRDGDIVLSTTYNPIPFNLVIYTEDNLSLQEKEEQKRIINQFWHEMKKQKKIFELESSEMFYEVKYNGLLECENHPKHLRFSLPFKSSRPYAYANEQKEMVGNSSVNSDTIEPVGFECVIKGPATAPKIYFNDYEMYYNNNLAEGSKLIINSKNSTATLILANETEVNAMKYYNHQFPKVENGNNTLKIESGVNASQVSIKWYDFKI